MVEAVRMMVSRSAAAEVVPEVRSEQASPTGVDTFHGKCGVEVLT